MFAEPKSEIIVQGKLHSEILKHLSRDEEDILLYYEHGNPNLITHADSHWIFTSAPTPLLTACPFSVVLICCQFRQQEPMAHNTTLYSLLM